MVDRTWVCHSFGITRFGFYFLVYVCNVCRFRTLWFFFISLFCNVCRFRTLWFFLISLFLNVCRFRTFVNFCHLFYFRWSWLNGINGDITLKAYLKIVVFFLNFFQVYFILLLYKPCTDDSKTALFLFLRLLEAKLLKL